MRDIFKLRAFICLWIAALIAVGTLARARAADPREVLNLIDILNTAPPAPPACQVSRPGKVVKNVVFLFEGRKGFTQELNEAFRKIQALNPVCEFDVATQQAKTSFSSALAIDFFRLRDQLHGLGLSDGGSPVAFKNFLLAGLCLHSKMKFEDTEVTYLPYSADIAETAKCASQFLTQSYKDDQGETRYPTLTVLGYSYGGHQALKFAHELDMQGIKIDLGITVDPVSQTAVEFLKGEVSDALDILQRRLLGNSVQTIQETVEDFEAPAGVQWVNFWQTIDNRVKNGTDPTLNLGLHGNSVRGASPNLQVTPPLDPNNLSPNGGHWRIFDDTRVSEQIQRALTAVVARGLTKSNWRKN
jgi:hypothetical protein